MLQKSQKRKRLKILQMHHQPEYFTSVDNELALVYFLKNIAANFLSRMLKNISFWKIHVKPSWFNDFVKAFFNCNLEKLHDILKTLKSRSTFVTKSRQSFKKELEHRTLNSVLQSIRESLMELIINEENLIA